MSAGERAEGPSCGRPQATILHSVARHQAVLALALACAVPAPGAQVYWQPEPDSDWVLERPVPDPLGGDGSLAIPEGGFANPDETEFRDRVGRGLFDRLCRRAKLEAAPRLGVDPLGGVAGRFGRRLRPLPRGGTAIIDTASVRFRAGGKLESPELAGVSLTLWAAGSVEGESAVMRPLPGRRACSELDRLVALREVKTVLPFTAERIAAMQVGELWRLPVRLDWGWAPGAEAGLGDVRVWISAGGSRDEGRAALTLYRLAPDRVRLRFRVESLEVRDRRDSVRATISPVQFGGVGGGFLTGLIGEAIGDELTDFLKLQFSHFHSDVQGQRIVLEAVLDPSDRAQLASLAELVRGDLRGIVRLVRRRRGLLPEGRSAEENAREIAARYASRVGGREITAIVDTVRAETRDWGFRLPLILERRGSSSLGEDRMERLGSGEGEVRIYHATRERERGLFPLPVAGPVTQRHAARSAQVITLVRAPAPASPPAAVYIRQEGFENDFAEAVRARVQQFSDLTALVGREAPGGPGSTRLPVERLFYDARGRRAPELPRRQAYSAGYDKGTMLLSVLVAPEGLSQALDASAEAVARALANVSGGEERERLAELAPHLAPGSSAEQVARAAAASAGDTVSPRRYLEAAERAVGLVHDLAGLRAAPDNDARARQLASLVAGRGRSGLSFDRFVSVLVQLVSPAHVRADFAVRVDKDRRGVQDLDARYRLNGGIDADPLVARAAELRSRFAGPDDIRD